MSIKILTIVFLLSLGSVMATNYNQTYINSSGLNTNIYFNISTYIDTVIINNTQISLYNISFLNNTENITTKSINITTTNQNYYSSQFPRELERDTYYRKYINLFQNNLEIIVNTNTTGITPQNPKILQSNGTLQNLTYNYNTLTQILSFNATINQNTTTVIFNESRIYFLDLYPVGDPSLSDGESQVFNYSLINPQGVSTNTNWFNDGSNITGCYNLSSCTLSVVGLSSGTRNITVSVTSASSGNLSYSWVLTIAPGSAETLAEICSNGANAQGELADWLQTIALVIAAVVVISAIGLYQSGNMPSFEVSGLGGVAIMLVGAAITIAVTSSIIVSAIC